MTIQQKQVAIVAVPLCIIALSVLGMLSVLFRPSTPAALALEAPYEAAVEKNGEVREFSITAAKGAFQLADGISIDAYMYNGSVPGPELRVQLGDTVKVNFTNDLPQETTVHWHGVRVPNAMDGVPGVTQDPIQPGEGFVYEFTPKDAGTFWFHPHVRGSEQLERGLYGTLVVEDPDEPGYDQDIVWALDDWRITSSGELDERFNTGHDLMHDGRWGNVVTVSGDPNTELSVDPGSTILLRLVNTANGRVFAPQFEEVDATVVAVDGMPVAETFDANGFELAPGNRIDVRITIPEELAGEELLVADVFPNNPYVFASLQVSEDTVNTSVGEPIVRSLPDWSEAVDAPPTAEYVLDAERRSMGMMNIAWTLNGDVYGEDTPFTFKHDEFAKIAFTNESARLHPMHIHGQFFRVLTRDGRAVNEPFLRDTVLVHADETVEIGMVPLDEGQWASHCHIQEHAEAGMMTTIIVE